MTHPEFRIHSEKSIYNSFQIEGNMIAVTILLSILNQMKFNLVQNQKENGHCDYFPVNLGELEIEFYECAIGITKAEKSSDLVCTREQLNAPETE